MKKSIIAITLALVFTLTGCSGTPDSVEDEVNSVLAPDGNTEDQTEGKDDPEPEPEPEPEPALEYVDVVDPDPALMTDAGLDNDVAEMITSEADDQGNVETVVEKQEPDTLQIVFMGDSIFDSVRDETGIAHIVAEALEADVYNLAIGGTSAALRRDKPTDFENWTEPSLMGVIYTMEKKLTNNVLEGYKSGEIMETLDPKKTDYFVIEYGTNDFLNYIPTGAEDIQQQYYFYYSTTLEMAVTNLRENYPKAQILFCTPYYVEFWSADHTRFIGDVHSVNNGFGTLLDYVGSMEGVAADKGVECLNMYNLMEMDAYNVEKMTVDGLHPNEEARKKYAGILIEKLKSMEEQKQSEVNTNG